MSYRFSIFLVLVTLLVTVVGGQQSTTPVVYAQTPTPAPGSIQLTGAGATFPFPLYSRWFYEYAFIDPSVRFNYQSIGSGGGIRQITANTVDFGASDAILNDDQRAAAPGLDMFPTVAGAVVVAYNVKDADGADLPSGLKLAPDIIADIFLGKITKWNDARLTEAEPRRQIAGPGYRGGPSLGWLRHQSSCSPAT